VHGGEIAESIGELWTILAGGPVENRQGSKAERLGLLVPVLGTSLRCQSAQAAGGCQHAPGVCTNVCTAWPGIPA
jgi:hypothetical protein